MKKLILLLLFIPLVSLGQDVLVDTYFDDGNKITEKTWTEEGQKLTLIETSNNEGSGYRYFVEDEGVEVGMYFYVTRQFGKYFRVEISVVNNTDNRVEFIPANIDINVNGDVRKKEKYKALSFEEYKKKVDNKVGWATGIVAGLNGYAEGVAGTTYSTSQSTNWDAGYPQITTTTTQSYSPALANMQRQQNQQNMNEMQEGINDEVQLINQGYLKVNTLFPNSVLEGYILIPYHRKVTDIDLIVNIAGKKFDFSNSKFHPELNLN